MIHCTVRVYVCGRGGEDVLLQRRLCLPVVPGVLVGCWPGRRLEVLHVVCDPLPRVLLECDEVVDETRDVRELAADAGPDWEVLPAGGVERWEIPAPGDDGQPPF